MAYWSPRSKIWFHDPGIHSRHVTSVTSLQCYVLVTLGFKWMFKFRRLCNILVTLNFSFIYKRRIRVCYPNLTNTRHHSLNDRVLVMSFIIICNQHCKARYDFLTKQGACFWESFTTEFRYGGGLGKTEIFNYHNRSYLMRMIGNNKLVGF